MTKPLDPRVLAYRAEKRAPRRTHQHEAQMQEARAAFQRQLAAMVPKRGRPKATTARSRI